MLRLPIVVSDVRNVVRPKFVRAYFYLHIEGVTYIKSQLRIISETLYIEWYW